MWGRSMAARRQGRQRPAGSRARAAQSTGAETRASSGVRPAPRVARRRLRRVAKQGPDERLMDSCQSWARRKAAAEPQHPLLVWRPPGRDGQHALQSDSMQLQLRPYSAATPAAEVKRGTAYAATHFHWIFHCSIISMLFHLTSTANLYILCKNSYYTCTWHFISM